MKRKPTRSARRRRRSETLLNIHAAWVLGRWVWRQRAGRPAAR